jgi:alanyl-tRNA synthetase
VLGAVMPLVEGRGGGKDDVAQGGGTDASRIDEALAAARASIAQAAG